MPMTDATGTIDADSLRQSLNAYREAAAAWLESVGRLGASERQIADRLAIGRMILHRLRRFVQAEDSISLLEHLPGGRGRTEIAETRLPDRLNASAVSDRLITATRNLDAVLRHVGSDRERARRLLASIDDDGRRRVLEDDRRTLFEAESRLQGVEADAVVGSVLVVPASDDQTCNTAGLQLIRGLQAHRPGTGATIYMAWNGYADLRHDGFPVNLDPDADEPLLRDAQASSIADRELISNYEFLRYRLRDDAPLERRVDLGFGEIHPNAGPMEGPDEDDAADFILPTFFPMRQAMMELWLHRTLRRALESPWTTFLQDYRFTPDLGSDVMSPTLDRLGDFSQVEDPLEPSDGVLGFRGLRRELLERAAARLDASLGDFEVFRASEPHPPVGSGIQLCWRLASPPDACTRT